jgi:hypothetical protein
MREEPLMCIDQSNQLKGSWENYVSRQGKAILKQMTPEQRQHAAELVQSRILLTGEQVKAPEIYKGLLKGLKSD